MISTPAQKFHWHLNEWMQRHLSVLSVLRGQLTVLDTFGAPGDTLLAATTCRILKSRFTGLRINLVTRWPDLVTHDPHLDSINDSETYFTLRFWYIDMVQRKEAEQNVLRETLGRVGITEYEYKACVYLTAEEKHAASERFLGGGPVERPRLAFCTLSKERVKNWPKTRWEELLKRLASDWDLVQIGDDREPSFEGVIRFSGHLSMRESMAVLSECQVFLGPDSFLMHAANGLNIPSVIIFGGSRPSACLGYQTNVNLFVPMPCGPCWIHDSAGQVCEFGVACMEKVSVNEVEQAVNRVGEGLLPVAVAPRNKVS